MAAHSREPASAFDAAYRALEAGRVREALDAVRQGMAARGTGAAMRRDGAAALQLVARRAAAAGDPALSEHALREAIALCPEHADLQLLHARTLMALGRPRDARLAVDAALSLNPAYAAARLERALLDAREGRLGEARDEVRSLAQGDAVADPVALAHGMRALDRAEWEEAGTLLRRALRLGDPDLDERLDRVRDLMGREALPAAADLLRGALATRARYPDLHALLGTIELRQGHWDDAVASLARALELHPDYHDARIELAIAFEGLGLRAQAMDQLALVLEHEPDHARALELHQRWTANHARKAA